MNALYFPVLLLAFLDIFNPFLQQKGEVTDLACLARNGRLEISCRVSGIDDSMVRQALDAGEVVGFEYFLEVRQSRSIWFSEFIGETVLKKELYYNNLTQQYFGLVPEKGQNGAELIFKDFDQAAAWLRQLQAAEWNLSKEFQVGKAYLRARVVLKRKSLLFLLPVETTTPWQRATIGRP